MDIADQINREDRSIKLLNFLLVGMRIIEVSVSGFTPELHIKVASLKHNPSPFRCLGIARITIAGPFKIGELAGFNGLPIICCEDMPERRFIDRIDVTDKLIIRFNDGLIIAADSVVENDPDWYCWTVQTLEDDRPDALSTGIVFYSDYDEKLVGKWYVDFEEMFLKSM